MLRPRGDALSAVARSVSSQHGRGHDGRRAEAEAPAGKLGVVAVVHEKANEEEEEVVGLTARQTSGSEESGTSRSKRGGARDLRRPTTEMKTTALLQVSRGRVLRPGAPWCRGGAPGHGCEKWGGR